MQAQSLGREDPLEKEMATCSSILAWKIPWTEEPDWWAIAHGVASCTPLNTPIRRHKERRRERQRKKERERMEKERKEKVRKEGKENH